MKIKSIEFEGFQSFAQRCYLEIPDGTTYIMGANKDGQGHADSNGSGKTSIMAAIGWAIYGIAPSGAKKHSIVTHGKDRAWAKVEFDNGACIERELSRTASEKVRFQRGDGIWVDGKLTEVQQHLDDFLNLKAHVYYNSIYLGKSSKSVKFLEATPLERSTVVQELVDNTPFKTAATHIKEEMNEHAHRIAQTEAILRELIGQENSLRKDVTTLQGQLAAVQQQEELRLKKICAQIAEVEKEMKRADDAIHAIPPRTMEELSPLRSSLTVKIRKLQEKMAEAKVYASLTAMGAGETCPTCLGVLEEDHCIELGGRIEDAKTSYKKAAQLLEATKKELEGVEDEINQARQHAMNVRQAEARLQELKQTKRILEDQLTPQDTKHMARQLHAAQQKLKDVLNRQEETKEASATVESRQATLRVLYKGFNSEITNFLFDRLRTGLEHYTGQYLYLLAGDAYTISYPCQTKSGQERFEIMMRSGHNTQDLACYSDGETWRATFAVLLALRRVLTEHKGNPFDFLLVDDPIGALDEVGVSNFVTQIKTLATEEIPQVLVTIPREVSIPRDANIIRVVKKGGSSHAFLGNE